MLTKKKRFIKSTLARPSVAVASQELLLDAGGHVLHPHLHLRPVVRQSDEESETRTEKPLKGVCKEGREEERLCQPRQMEKWKRYSSA
jgi:hypothetical protein